MKLKMFSVFFLKLKGYNIVTVLLLSNIVFCLVTHLIQFKKYREQAFLREKEWVISSSTCHVSWHHLFV